MFYQLLSTLCSKEWEDNGIKNWCSPGGSSLMEETEWKKNKQTSQIDMKSQTARSGQGKIKSAPSRLGKLFGERDLFTGSPSLTSQKLVGCSSLCSCNKLCLQTIIALLWLLNCLFIWATRDNVLFIIALHELSQALVHIRWIPNKYLLRNVLHKPRPLI